MITGAAAAILYGEPRMTLDLDLVINVQKNDISTLGKEFPPEAFYLPPEEVLYVEISRPQRGHFNIIHHESGLRADIYLMGNDPLHHWGMQHRRSLAIDSKTAWIAPPEYVIVRKLQYFQEGQSQKHLRDVQSMLEVSKEQIDLEQLEKFIVQYRLKDVWQQVND